MFWPLVFVSCILSVYFVVNSAQKERGDASLSISLLILSCFSILLLGEGVVRLKDTTIKGESFLSKVNQNRDSILGWKGTLENITPSGALVVNTKILFLGDEYTHTNLLPLNQKYPSIVADLLQTQVSIYSGDGYGTLQELLALRNIKKEITPALVILQMSSNDLINNSYELEKRSNLERPNAARPFWIDGRIQYKFSGFFGSSEEIFIKHSKLFNTLFNSLNSLSKEYTANGYLDTIENKLIKDGSKEPLFRDALQKTQDILFFLQEELKDIKFAVFISDSKKPFNQELKSLVKKLGISFIETQSFEKPFETTSQKELGENIARAVHRFLDH